MRKFNCHNCKQLFTVNEDSWTSVYCPHCNKINILPNHFSVKNETEIKENIIYFKMMIGIGSIILGLLFLL